MAGTEHTMHDANETTPPVKKSKLDDDAPAQENGADLTDLSAFRTERILSCDSKSKTIVALGAFADPSQRALVVLQKEPFQADGFDKLCSAQTTFKKVFRNDVYGNYDCFIASELNAVKATVIHPASDKHIQKYETQMIHIVEETPEVYKSVTLPHLEKEQLNLQWVYNILEHKSEVERIVLEDTDPSVGFVLLPDLKWDCKDLKSLYLLAIIRQSGIKSLRDLTAEHIPLLENILTKCTNIITERYSLPASRIRAFFHYQPSFYHLHVHFTYLQYDAPGIHVERAHMLTTVINNLKLVPNYYQTITLPFTVKQSDKLFTSLNEKGILA